MWVKNLTLLEEDPQNALYCMDEVLGFAPGKTGNYQFEAELCSISEN